MHQLRVAAVAKLVCENFTKPIDADNVVLACLFHDMGNIIKSDLSYFPEFLEPEGLAYWQTVKDGFIQKYGTEEHIAMLSIAKEVGLPPAAINYLENIGFSKLENTAARDSFEIKICSYADMRVGPYRVLSIDERLAEGRKRYEGRKDSKAFATERFEVVANALHRVEEQIFSFEKIDPEDIAEETIETVLEDLKRVRL
jgi:hypothetical protein